MSPHSWRAALLEVSLIGGLLLVGCVALPDGPSTRTTHGASGASAPPSAGASPSDASPPPLNALEVKIIDALASLGLEGQRAQLPFQNADIYAVFGDRQLETGQLFVSAHPPGTDRGDYTVIDERQLEGIRVQRVRSPGAVGPIYRFACADGTYTISGAVPPWLTGPDDLVGRFIRAIDCRA